MISEGVLCFVCVATHLACVRYSHMIRLNVHFKNVFISGFFSALNAFPSCVEFRHHWEYGFSQRFSSIHCTVCTLESTIAPYPRIFGVFLESGLSPFIKVVRWPWFSFLTYQENKPFFARFQSYLVSKPRKISEI